MIVFFVQAKEADFLVRNRGMGSQVTNYKCPHVLFQIYCFITMICPLVFVFSSLFNLVIVLCLVGMIYSNLILCLLP